MNVHTYAEPGNAGHKAYWHAAESVLAARQLAGLEPAADASPGGTSTAQLAADIYRGLPGDERAAVAEMVAAVPSITWLGDPAGPDEHAAAQPAYSRHLASALASRGHTVGGVAIPPERRHAGEDEPPEAGLAHRGRPGEANSRPVQRPIAGPGTRSQSSQLGQLRPQPYRPAIGPTPVR